MPAEQMPEPAREELPKLIESVFCPDGLLQQALGLEHRPQQHRMATRAVDAMLDDRPLLFEAGTGVGKSLAYLVPGILCAMHSQRPLVVATHTIALQEQIQNNDLNLCRMLFDRCDALKPFRAFRLALLTGRRNYLCTPRLIQAISAKTELFPSREQEELERIAEWSTQTQTGLREELSPPPLEEVWDWVNADSSLSNPKNPECFYQKARARLREAHLIIVNHALLFSLINAGAAPGGDSRGVLFPNDFLVLDEAHRVPGVATDHFGMTLSSAGLDRTLKMLYNPRRKKGLLTRYHAQRDCAHLVKTLDIAETFFNQLRQQYLRKHTTVRLFEEGWGDSILLPALKELSERLGSLAQQLDSEQARDEVLDQRRRVNAALHALDSALSLAEEDHVYWLEKSGKHGSIVHINAAPLDVEPILRATLFERGTCSLLTSATLASAGSMEPFQARVGAKDEDSEIVHSPFDYARNMRIRIARNMPAPSREAGRLDITFLARMICNSLSETTGGMLALFTSYQDMHAVARTLEGVCEAAGRPFFMQGQGYGRTELTRRFSEAGNGVLLGTDSYWTGVDVPGSALEHVVITRLPFENPGHPVLQARSEWLESKGLNAFATMTLPDAIIKFRQGIGRLIRKQDDCGVVTILDSRILTKPYGRHFLAAMPKQEFDIIAEIDGEEDFHRR